MSALLYRLGRISARHPFRVLGLWVVAAIAVMALQGAAGGEFNDSERVPGVESQYAADVQAYRAKRPRSTASMPRSATAGCR